jgi:hypothetical protein
MGKYSAVCSGLTPVEALGDTVDKQVDDVQFGETPTREQRMTFVFHVLRVLRPLLLAGLLLFPLPARASAWNCVRYFVGLFDLAALTPPNYPRAAASYLRSYDPLPLSQLVDTLGVEIEGGAPYSKNPPYTVGHFDLRDAIARKLAGAHPDLITTKSERPVPDSSFIDFVPKITYRRGEDEYHWVFDRDHSIKTPRGYDIAEISSPILRDKEDRTEFFQVLPELEKAGMRPEPLSAGVHFHIGFSQPRPGELAFLTLAFSAVERDLARILAVSPSRYEATQITPQVITTRLASGRVPLNSTDALLKFLARDRNRSLNLLSLHLHQTVEFRLLNSTLDAREIEAVSEFLRYLVQGIRTQEPRLVNLIRSMGDRQELSAIEMVRVLDLSPQNLEWFERQAQKNLEHPLPPRPPK